MITNLEDVSFLIPFKKDSEERIRNLNFNLEYLNKYFKTNVFIIECDIDQKYTIDVSKYENLTIDYEFRKADNYLFHRTKYLNDMAKKSKTSCICLYDLDVVFTVSQYLLAYQAISTNVADLTFPYGGRFIDFDGENLNTIMQNVSLDNITESHGNCYNANSVGGAIFLNKTKFIEYGMENEYFVSWGFEDLCRVTRAQKLGLKIVRIPGILYHLHHPTSQNSSNTQHREYVNNQFEFHKVSRMNPHELREYVLTWKWGK
jgi:hypothetical protein